MDYYQYVPGVKNLFLSQLLSNSFQRVQTLFLTGASGHPLMNVWQLSRPLHGSEAQPEAGLDNLKSTQISTTQNGPIRIAKFRKYGC